MKLRLLLLGVLSLTLLGRAERPLDKLEGRPQELLDASLRFAEPLWDEEAGLLWSPTLESPIRSHRSRESAWYALGLLTRGNAGDETRALRILDRVLSLQIDAPGQPWDGTFRRTPEEPVPAAGAVLWKDFDPNWRHFLGTTFAIVLIEFESKLPAGLSARLMASIRRSVQSELAEGRDEPYHTNIALMHGFLWNWAGSRLGRTEWVAESEAWARSLKEGFDRHGTFEEYNSPTYYGVDLYGLALWRRHGATEKIREYGAHMEAGLWRDIAQFYHAGLRNLCGPFDRAYGLDQRGYVSLLGIWMGLALEAEFTPLPDPSGPMDHAHDFFFTTNFVALGAQLPTDILAGLSSFQGNRSLERVITPQRTATAWIAADLMYGGETTQKSRGAGPGSAFGQFHPATAHWRIGTNDVGAFALIACPPVDAKAAADGLSIRTEKGDSKFRFVGPGITAGMFRRNKWSLPNLEVDVETDASQITITEIERGLEVVYREGSQLDLRFTRKP
jgi:hypothetical protein